MKSVKQLKIELNAEQEIMELAYDDQRVDEAEIRKANVAKLHKLIEKAEAQEIIKVGKEANENIYQVAIENAQNGDIVGMEDFYYMIDKQTNNIIEIVKKNGYSEIRQRNIIVELIIDNYGFFGKEALSIAKTIIKNFPTYNRTFEPTGNKIFFDTNTMQETYNTYIEPPLLQIREERVKQANEFNWDKFKAIKAVMFNLFQDKSDLDHWVNYFSHIIQTKQKINKSFVFIGDSGAGKGILFELIIQKIFSEKYAIEIGKDQLYSKINENWILDKIFISGDEIKEGHNDTRNGSYNMVKNLITSKTLKIEEKGVPTYQRPNTINLMFSSNEAIPFRIEVFDRRFVVIYTGGLLSDNYKGMKTLEEDIANELEEFVREMNRIIVDIEATKSIYNTKAKKMVAQGSDTLINNIVFALKSKDIDTIRGLVIEADLTEENIESNIKIIEADMNNNVIRNNMAHWLFETSKGEEISAIKVGKLFGNTLKSETFQKKINGKNTKYKVIIPTKPFSIS